MREQVRENNLITTHVITTEGTFRILGVSDIARGNPHAGVLRSQPIDFRGGLAVRRQLRFKLPRTRVHISPQRSELHPGCRFIRRSDGLRIQNEIAT